MSPVRNQPSVAKHFARLFRLLVIALHHARPLHQNLAILRDAHFHIRDRPPHRPYFVRVRHVRGNHRRSLRQSISLIHRQSHRPEKFREFRRKRRSAGTERAASARPVPREFSNRPAGPQRSSATSSPPRRPFRTPAMARTSAPRAAPNRKSCASTPSRDAPCSIMFA